MGIKSEEIRYTTSVIAVPVCQEHMRKLDAMGFQGVGDKICPFWNPLTGVDD